MLGGRGIVSFSLVITGGYQMKKRMSTWAGRSTFIYDGDPLKNGTKIKYGSGYQSKIVISASQYSAMINNFSKNRVPIGTSRDNPPSNSLGKWLQANVTKTATASYVGSILVEHRLAVKHGSEIEFH